MKKFILQAITDENHLTAIQQLLSIPDPEQIIISTAFMNESGLSVLEAKLTPVADCTVIFAGIRNGITTAQGLQRAIDIGCKVIAVDTGSRLRIFHPKIYFSQNAETAHLITGSANLTIGGLNSNIEASIWQELALADAENAELIEDVKTKLLGMQGEYPEHVFEVANAGQIAELLESGRLADESIPRPPIPAGSSRNRDKDSIPIMPLKTRQMRRIVTPKMKTKVSAKAKVKTPPAPALELIWESKPLTRRYLTIPTGSNTHSTGSMLFTKGTLEDIDQRHYFRDEVFENLDWDFDVAAGREHLERAQAQFGLVIRDVDYGIFNLRVSHNSRTDTKSYAQRNSMTQLHWGDARELVAREDLLDRVMSLYRDNTQDGFFVIEID